MRGPESFTGGTERGSSPLKLGGSTDSSGLPVPSVVLAGLVLTVDDA